MQEKDQRILTKEMKEIDMEEVSWSWAMNDKWGYNTWKIVGNAVHAMQPAYVQAAEVWSKHRGIKINGL